jgi:uncharacterized membrane protein YoaK (UPF0700 family)
MIYCQPEKRFSSMTTATHRDPLPFIHLVLTMTTGLIDAVSVLGLGRVFTANMTGNIVFLGFALSGAREYSVARSLVALAGFLLGAMVGGRLGVMMSTESRRRWLLRVILLEVGLFFAAAIISIGYDINTISRIGRLYTLIALTAAAMGLRNATVRRLAVPDLTTTVLTLTLTGLDALTFLTSHNPWRKKLNMSTSMS